MNTVSGVPHCAAVDRELFVQRRRKYDRARYWDPAKKVRKSRLARSARKSGRPPKPIQLKLHEVASTAQNDSRASSVPPRAGITTPLRLTVIQRHIAAYMFNSTKQSCMPKWKLQGCFIARAGHAASQFGGGRVERTCYTSPVLFLDFVLTLV